VGLAANVVSYSVRLLDLRHITDADNGAVRGLTSGVVFLADGTRLIMSSGLSGSARCTSIIDRNGNSVNIQYDTPQTGDVTYTDQLNRQVILHELQGTPNPHDATGNLTRDPITGNTFTYDGENKQVTATVGPNTSNYTYDADGRRVQKLSGGVTTIYVYNVSGELIAEYNNSRQPPVGGGGTSYLTIDHLGSTRVVTNPSAAIKSRHDYMPFGEEIGALVGTRSTIDGKYDVDEGIKQRLPRRSETQRADLITLRLATTTAATADSQAPMNSVAGLETYSILLFLPQTIPHFMQTNTTRNPLISTTTATTTLSGSLTRTVTKVRIDCPGH
jgi:hypothetical protein